MDIYTKTSIAVSQRVTKNYSTSFYFAGLFFSKEVGQAIYSIYGFVRFADEIVDTFHQFDKELLLNKFEKDYHEAVRDRISLNPILHSFQRVVHKYGIEEELVTAFMNSMRQDLNKSSYATTDELHDYIYGSADVVGLMCLKTFCNGDQQMYQRLKEPAQRLGAAFQKVNFLRDLKDDLDNLGRCYFVNTDGISIQDEQRQEIIADIESDFRQAAEGIRQLPQEARLAVFVAYLYYKDLLGKIRKTPIKKMMQQRIRITNSRKVYLIVKAYMLMKFNIIK